MAAKGLGKSLMGSLHRAKQFTEEKLGHSEKTEYDAQFENLAARTDRIKQEIEHLLKQMNAYLQPNPTRRLETTVYKKLNRKAKERQSETEVLAETMLTASATLGTDTPYGKALAEVGHGQKVIADQWAALEEGIDDGFMRPMRVFLDSEIKQAALERKTLGRLRLDLDYARTQARKASTQDKLAAAEQDVATAQTKYEQQYEVTKLLLQNVQRRNEEGIHRLLAFVNAQKSFFTASTNAANTMAASLRGLLNVAEQPQVPERPAPAYTPVAAPSSVFVRVLCDYEAVDDTELSLVADEVISVHRDVSLPKGWVVGSRNGATGKVATSYLDIDPAF